MKYTDLTVNINEDTPVYAGDPKPVFSQTAYTAREGWNNHTFTINSHLGTHIDYPYHMFDGGKTQSDYGINYYMGNGKLIDVRGRSLIDADLTGAGEGDIILLFSGAGAGETPAVTQAFAQKLIDKKIKIVGTDSWTVDEFPFAVHKLLLSNDILIVENLTNLGALLNKKFKIFIAPMKLDSMGGSPCRAFAETDD
jgi:kynurenine formamidase